MIDIIVLAIITFVLVARLWSVLGQGGDEGADRPNPFSDFGRSRNGQDAHDDENIVILPDRKKSPDQPPPLPLSAYTASAPPNSLAGGIEQIIRLDPSFDEKKFIQGAKIAFSMIVESFAKSDLSQIERFLAPSVLYSFRQAISARQEAGEILETAVKEITEAEVITAGASNSRAFLTVSFTSKQTNVTRNSSGAIISGSPEQAEEIHDVWTFSRDTKSNDPNWQLVETKS